MFGLQVWPGRWLLPKAQPSGHEIAAGRPAKRRNAPYGRHFVTRLVSPYVPTLERNGTSVNENHALKRVVPVSAMPILAKPFIRRSLAVSEAGSWAASDRIRPMRGVPATTTSTSAPGMFAA